MAVRRKKVAVIHCNGRPTRKEGFEQVTVTGNCQEILTQYPEGINICSYGCLGGGSCVEACRLHAVSIGERGIAKIDEEKCVGCGLCAKACPQHLIQVVPTENTIQPQCANLDKGPKAIQGCAVSCIDAEYVRNTVHVRQSKLWITTLSFVRKNASPVVCVPSNVHGVLFTIKMVFYP